MLDKYNITQTTLKLVELYANDYTKALHLREIARETRVDVKAIHLQLRKLERISILSSTTRGRNKEYSLNLDNIVTRYYLIMSEIFAAVIYLEKNFLIRKIIHEVEDKIDGPIILFGSFVGDRHVKESDVDMFVISEKKIDRRIVLETARRINHDINIRSTSGAKFLSGLRGDDPLVKEVLTNHIVLKGADRFCDIVWRYYAAK